MNCPECKLELDDNSLIAWCENGHVYRLKKRKCTGSGLLPTVERPGPNPWSSVTHHCSQCGRVWRRNGENNGWEKLPIPAHYAAIRQVGEKR